MLIAQIVWDELRANYVQLVKYIMSNSYSGACLSKYRLWLISLK